MVVIIDIIMYMVIGGVLSAFFYYWRKRDLLGGYIGGIIIASLGAILGSFFLIYIIDPVIRFLQNGAYISNVNILSGLIGGYIFLYIFNKINNDRIR